MNSIHVIRAQAFKAMFSVMRCLTYALPSRQPGIIETIKAYSPSRVHNGITSSVRPSLLLLSQRCNPRWSPGPFLHGSLSHRWHSTQHHAEKEDKWAQSSGWVLVGFADTCVDIPPRRTTQALASSCCLSNGRSRCDRDAWWTIQTRAEVSERWWEEGTP